MASNDAKTTLLGIAAGGLLAANLDWAKLFNRDRAELAKAGGAVIVAMLGFYTNKPSEPK